MRQLHQFRILTIVGYTLVLLILIGMPIAAVKFEQYTMPIPVVLPVGIVGVVLMLVVAFPFIWAAYEKTICPHCGKLPIENPEFTLKYQKRDRCTKMYNEISKRFDKLNNSTSNGLFEQKLSDLLRLSRIH